MATDPVTARLATTQDISLAPSIAQPVIDTVPVANGDVILVRHQDNPATNGVYQVALAASTYSWNRYSVPNGLDFTVYSAYPGLLVVVREGKNFHDTVWECNSPVVPNPQGFNVKLRITFVNTNPNYFQGANKFPTQDVDDTSRQLQEHIDSLVDYEPLKNYTHSYGYSRTPRTQSIQVLRCRPTWIQGSLVWSFR